MRYAVTVSRKDGKFRFFDIRRKLNGEIFFNVPGLAGGSKKWRPHVGVHADGTVFHKDFNKRSLSRELSKPDVSFIGTENVTGIAINSEQWKTIKKPYPDPTLFAALFEIDVEKSSLGTRMTQLQLDIVEPNAQPNLISGDVLQQTFFKDEIPWIVITLIDTTRV